MFFVFPAATHANASASTKVSRKCYPRTVAEPKDGRPRGSVAHLRRRSTKFLSQPGDGGRYKERTPAWCVLLLKCRASPASPPREPLAQRHPPCGQAQPTTTTWTYQAPAAASASRTLCGSSSPSVPQVAPSSVSSTRLAASGSWTDYPHVLIGGRRHLELSIGTPRRSN